MKKVLAILLALMLVLSLAACGSKDTKSDEDASAAATDASGAQDATDDATEPAETPTIDSSFKAGFIFLHDENSTYDKNFIDAANAACEELGIEAIIKTNIPEGQECFDGFSIINKEKAMELIRSGRDENGVFYSVYTWMALVYFAMDMWK